MICTISYTNPHPYKEISKDKGPVYITTFAISDLEDLKVLQDYLKVVFKELRKRFKKKWSSKKDKKSKLRKKDY